VRKRLETKIKCLFFYETKPIQMSINKPDGKQINNSEVGVYVLLRSLADESDENISDTLTEKCKEDDYEHGIGNREMTTEERRILKVNNAIFDLGKKADDELEEALTMMDDAYKSGRKCMVGADIFSHDDIEEIVFMMRNGVRFMTREDAGRVVKDKRNGAKFLSAEIRAVQVESAIAIAEERCATDDGNTRDQPVETGNGFKHDSLDSN